MQTIPINLSNISEGVPLKQFLTRCTTARVTARLPLHLVPNPVAEEKMVYRISKGIIGLAFIT